MSGICREKRMNPRLMPVMNITSELGKSAASAKHMAPTSWVTAAVCATVLRMRSSSGTTKMAAIIPARGLLRNTAFAASLAAKTCTATIMPKVV